MRDVTSTEDTECSTAVNSLLGSTNKKKRSDNTHASKELINALCKSIQTREQLEKLSETDEDRMFLLSLLPELKKISEPLKFPTKMEIMNVIQKAKMGSSSSYNSSEVPTYCQMTPVHSTYIGSSSYSNLTEQQFQTCVVSELKVSPSAELIAMQSPDAVAEPKEEV